MATISKNLIIGTTAVLGARESIKRIGWRLYMIKSAIEAGNTGRIHAGKGFVPTSVLGEPNTGEVVGQGDQISESKAHPVDKIFTGDIWLLASAAGQRSVFEEVLED